MNKKLNTVLFVIGATVFNLLVMILLILICLLLISIIFRDRAGSQTLFPILMMVLFLASIAGTFIIYRKVLSWISRRFDLEKYFLPLWKRKR